MTIHIASNVGPSNIDIAYERLGDATAPPVLLIMGLGAQLIGWPDAFCDALLAHGLQVIRFDNRDAGQSTHFTNAAVPNLPAALMGDLSSAAYTLSDMAADTVGLLDALGLGSVHLVGASMGGFIAQTLAIEYPARVRSLTSMLSSTGDRTVGQIAPAAMGVFGGAPVTTREQAIERSLAVYPLIGSPAYPSDPESVAERAGRAYDRGFDAVGMARQGLAVIASGDRTEKLRSIRVPTLVMHGSSDNLVNVSGGRATAAAIPGAMLVVFEGMGHDLPRALWPEMTAHIAENIKRGEAAHA